VYNQSLNEHICLECEKGIGLPRKKFNVGAQRIEDFGELPLLDNDFDDTVEEIEEFIEKQPESH